MNKIYNPYTYLNAYISLTRNVILTSSIGLVLINNNYKVISLLVFIFSIVYCIKGSIDFNKYINYLEKSEIDDLLRQQLKDWKIWILINIIYIIIIILMCVYLIFKNKSILLSFKRNK